MDKLPINWCRISSINSLSQSPFKTPLFFFLAAEDTTTCPCGSGTIRRWRVEHVESSPCFGQLLAQIDPEKTGGWFECLETARGWADLFCSFFSRSWSMKALREPRTPFWQLNRCIGHAHQKAKDENHQQQKACEMTLALVQGQKNQFEVWWNTPYK